MPFAERRPPHRLPFPPGSRAESAGKPGAGHAGLAPGYRRPGGQALSSGLPTGSLNLAPAMPLATPAIEVYQATSAVTMPM